MNQRIKNLSPLLLTLGTVYGASKMAIGRIDRRHVWPDDMNYKRPGKVNLVVLHHTVGRGGLAALQYMRQTTRRLLNDPRAGYAMGTGYVIDLNGTAYVCFEDDRWAFHLGVGGPVGLDKRSIGIELDNLGGLRPDSKGGFLDIYGWPYKGEVYDHGETWRGFRYFAAYSEAQIQSLIFLLKDLWTRHNVPRVIPKDFFPADGLPFWKYATAKGLWTHTHFRSAGSKHDCHPGLIQFLPRIRSELGLVEV